MTALAVNVVNDRPIIRRSLAESLLACPQFQMDDGEQLAFGTSLHAFIAAYTLLCKSSGEETRFTDVSRLASEAWARTPGLLQSRYAEFMDLCDHFAETRPAELQTLMHVEHTLTHDIGWALLTCTVDRMDRTDFGDPDEAPISIQISDWKSERAEADHDFQGRFYSQMAFLAFPSVMDVVFAVHALRDWWKPEPAIFHRGQLDLWWRTTLAGLQARLATPNAAPVGGPACPSCAKRYECSKATAAARLIPENDDQATEILQDRLRMAEGVSVIDDALKLYLSGRPELIAAGHEVGYLRTREESFKVTAPASKLLPWLRKKRMDMDAMLKAVTITNRGVQEKLIEAGLAVREFNPAAYKIRKYLPAKQTRKSDSEERSE
jgi:hypothetical protein